MAKDDDSPKLSAVEGIKSTSNFLRGEIAQELQDANPNFGSSSVQLLKHHGTYQQDDRDQRMANRSAGSKDKSFIMMVRSRVTGGALSAEQMLAELQISDDLGDGTMRLTTRQAIQHHGILKSDLKELMQRIHQVKMSSLGACGDVNRNVMCCPAPYNDGIHAQIHELAQQLSDHFLPHSGAYYEIWLKDLAGGDKELVASAGPQEEDEPIYGKTYLPRKFKTAIALPHDNCIDIYTNDLGYLAVIQDGKIIGYNVSVGGGMGTTPAIKRTFPALAKRMAFVTPEQAIKVGEMVVKVQRDFGNRADRKVARLKYLINDWGVDKFRAKVEEYLGEKLPDCHPTEVHDYPDHMGWEEQGDGRWFYGLNIENGRIKDDEHTQLKSAIREIARTLKPDMRITAHQSLLFTNIAADARKELESIFKKHKIKTSDQFSETRRWSMACVAWPTCGLAITESERALPGVIDELEAELNRLGLADEKMTIRMTGCPNGCARPYNADIGLVGKAKDAYTVYLGGAFLGTRLAFVFMDKCGREELVPTLVKVFELFKEQRQPKESFGDFCARVGCEALLSHTAGVA
jgi:sulfite reductase (ferredoxin)